MGGRGIKDVYCYNVITDEWAIDTRSELPTECYGCAIAMDTDTGLWWTFGGQNNESFTKYLSDVCDYNPATRKWTMTKSRMVRECSHATAV
jgi:N-acetylneuraminic acid mutarotase